MTGSLLITLREGLEAFLVVGIILSYLSRLDLRRYNKWVYTGVGLGVGSAFALALVFQLVFTGFHSESAQLYIKIGIMGFAVAILSYMVVWMSKNARAIRGSVERKLDDAVSSGSVAALVLMAYLAVLREGFETVLFLGALYGADMGPETLYGGVIGLALALGATYAVFTSMRRIPLSVFFKLTGALIILIAAGLLTNMTGMMQDINLLPVMKDTVFDISWLMEDSSDVGIFFKALFGYTSAPTLLQAAVYVGYLAAVSAFLLRDDIFKRKSACV